MKRTISLALCCVLLLGALCGCSPKAQPQTDGITVTDCAGRTVTVPADPQSISVLCPFSGPMLVMFGYGDRITTTVNNAARSKLLAGICPAMENAVVVKNSGAINAEEIMAREFGPIKRPVYSAVTRGEKAAKFPTS